MKKLTKSVLAVVLTASFTVSYAQKTKVDTAVTKNIEEVVVNALGFKVKKEQLASSYSKVKGESVLESGETSALKGMTGKMSGVSIVSNSGDPGSAAYIQIRGQNSITGSNAPLYVVDGVPVSNDEIGVGGVGGVGQASRINDINPNDIESMQVLKGTSASALWGYRARNGVIIITTKKGQKGKISVSYRGSLSIDQINGIQDKQSNFGSGRNGVYSPTPSGGLSWGDYIPNRAGGVDQFNTTGAKFIADNGTVYYPITKKNSKELFNESNKDAIFGNGVASDHFVSVSGGNDRGNFSLGLGRLNQEGVIRNSDYNRTSLSFNSEVKVSDKTTFKGTFAYSHSTSNRIQQGSNLSGMMLGYLRGPADFDIRNHKGTYFDAAGNATLNAHRSYRNYLGANANPVYNNPLWTIYEQLNPNEVDSYRIGAEINHKFNKWATLTGRFGQNNYTDKRMTIFPINSAENAGKGRASQQVINYIQNNIDVILNGGGQLTDKLELNYIAGVNYMTINYNSTGGGYINFLTDTNKFSFDNSTVENRTVFLDRSETKANSAYFTTTFDYSKFLFLTLGGRFETSSSLSPNLKVYFYPQAELGFDVAKLAKQNWLNTAKLRATYGQVSGFPDPYVGYTYYVGAGNSEGYGPAYDAGSYNGSFARSSNLGNENLKPEVKKEFEIGVDLKLFNRLNATFTFYDNENKDLLIFSSLNPSSGFDSKFGNFATMTNKGFEVELDYDIIKNQNFTWNLYGNWYRNRNMVTSLSGSESILLNGFTGTSSRAVEGYAMGALWGVDFLRDTNGNLVLDSNGFAQADTTEKVLGDPNPDFKAGLGTKMKYKNFGLNVLFDGSFGGDLWDGTNGVLNYFGTAEETGNVLKLTQAQASALLNASGQTALSRSFGTENGLYLVRGNIGNFGSGDVLLDQAWYTGLGGGFGPVSSQFIKDATWIKLRQISLDYTLKGDFLNRNGIESLNIGVSGRNLWYWTKDDTIGVDPESNLTGGSNGRGLQYFNNPNTKSYIFTLQLNF